HSGEEAGMRQGATAIEQQASMEWEVHCPPRLGAQFDGQKVTEHDELDLTISLRSRRADDLHAWVAALLAGELGKAARLADVIQGTGFPMYISRDLEASK